MAQYYPEFAGAFAGLLADLAGKAVAVVGHARPDGDCIGSQVALSRVLAARGCRVTCVNPDPVPRRLAFAARGTAFIRTDEALRLPADTVAVYVDCADHARPGERLRARFPSPAGCIDHHLSNPGFAAVNIVDAASAAACEILAGLFLDAGLPVDAATATALFVGILTDTGQFRYGSTSRRCFVLAGELVARGASPPEAGYELYERESAGKMRLLQSFLASLKLERGGRVCVGTVAPGIFESTGTSAEDTEGLVDYARSIDGVDVGVLVEERPDGSVKASLRAKDPLCRLDLVAGKFGGGGHACAAGLNQKAAGADFRERLLAAIGERLDVLDKGREEEKR
ncbi:MAG TPA: DHH family phosphoesterase [Opitutaceae bacterium]|jgi:phosphoesterase RecJ-like protein